MLVSTKYFDVHVVYIHIIYVDMILILFSKAEEIYTHIFANILEQIGQISRNNFFLLLKIMKNNYQTSISACPKMTIKFRTGTENKAIQDYQVVFPLSL